MPLYEIPEKAPIVEAAIETPKPTVSETVPTPEPQAPIVANGPTPGALARQARRREEAERLAKASEQVAVASLVVDSSKDK